MFAILMQPEEEVPIFFRGYKKYKVKISRS